MKSHRMRTIGVLAVGLLALLVATGVTGASGTFAPTITLETSTTRATAHPDARITIDNSASAENIRDLTLDLPNGFWGSLAAVATRCTAVQVTAEDCPEASRVGTVTARATITDEPDTETTANGVLSGGVYLTDDLENDDDPAGLVIIVDAKVGGVDLGKVVVAGRAIARNTPLTAPTTPTGAIGPAEGIRTVVTDIPQSIHDDVNNRDVSYFIETMQIDLKSELDGANSPLLTNPSKCSTVSISGTATSYGDENEPISDDYTVGQCSTTKFAPTSTLQLTNPVASGESGISGQINFGTDSSSLSSIKTILPPTVGANFPAFGSANDMCTGSAVTNFVPSGQPELGTLFNPTVCPVQAKFGRVTIETPLLPDPVHGDVYLINKVPLPWLGIDVSPQSDGNNPAGVTIRMLGKVGLEQVDPSCTASFCQEQITAEFLNAPDAPATTITLDLDRPDRWDPTPGVWRSSKMLAVADNGDSTCLEQGDMPLVFGNNSGTQDSAAVSEQVFTGCGDPKDVEITSGVADGTPGSGRTSDRTPAFDFTYSGSDNLLCAVDAYQDTAVPCSAPTYQYAGADLDDGIHTVYVGEDGGTNYRAVRRFVVEQDAVTVDPDAPSTSLSAVPATTSDSSPTFTFNANETSEFQCSVDDGAYLPCGSATGTASESFTIPEAEKFEASDDTHTFAVRAQDAAGNVDLTPATASFKVVIPFAPTTSIGLTSYVARAHPEMNVTIDNLSHEDVKDYTLQMPEGLFGAITAVQARCDTAIALAGNCDVGAKVGDVTATAVIDRSTVTTKGGVYMTRAWQAGDPAGLAIIVKPKLQDVTFEPIVVTARLRVRGQAQGIDALTIDIPNTATSTIGEISEFDMRKIVLDLKNNPLGTQPLLTNPSACDAKAFDVSYTGYQNTTSSYSIPYQATGCENLSFAPTLGITQFASNGGGVPKESTLAKVENIDFTATMVADSAGAAIKTVDIVLPRPVTIDVAFLPYPCQEAEAALKACPASSAIGTVTAISPLLDTPLTGNVYVLKSPTSLPRLLIALRGEIDVDLVAASSFTGANFGQIRTQFEFIPDVPMTSFSMRVNKFLRTREDACATPPSQWSILGSMGAYNGASQAVNIPLAFDCSGSGQSEIENGPVFTDKYKPRKSKTTYSVKIRAQNGKKLKKATISLPKGLSFISKTTTKKRLSKYVSVKVDGKRLKSKCFKKRGKNKLEIGLCRKKAKKIEVSFKKGSLTTRSKKTKKFKIQVIDSGGKKRNAVDIG